MKIKNIPCQALLTLSLLFSQSISAKDWYIGLDLGRSDIDSGLGKQETEALIDTINPAITFTNTLNLGDTATKFFVGKSINKNLALEGGYLDLGEVVDIKLAFNEFMPNNPFFFLTGDEVLLTSLTVDGFYFTSIGHWPLNDIVSLNARTGLYIWELRSEVELQNNSFGISASDSDKSTSGDLFLGIGIDIGWLGIQYEVYDIDGNNVEYIGASLEYRF